MDSVIGKLNELLAGERGELEAVKIIMDDLQRTDPDIAASAADVLDTARWSCSGLYHRITQLHGTPSLDSTDLAEQVSEKDDIKAKLKLLCKSQKHDSSNIKSLLKDDLDNDTRSFLEDLLKAHQQTGQWCKSTIGEWEPDEQ